jgi:hypothetical protein
VSARRVHALMTDSTIALLDLLVEAAILLILLVVAFGGALRRHLAAPQDLHVRDWGSLHSAPKEFVEIRRLDANGAVLQAWTESDPVVIATRVLQERRAGHTGEMVKGGNVVRTW